MIHTVRSIENSAEWDLSERTGMFSSFTTFIILKYPELRTLLLLLFEIKWIKMKLLALTSCPFHNSTEKLRYHDRSLFTFWGLLCLKGTVHQFYMRDPFTLSVFIFSIPGWYGSVRFRRYSYRRTNLDRSVTPLNRQYRPKGSKKWKTRIVNHIPELVTVPWIPQQLFKETLPQVLKHLP